MLKENLRVCDRRVTEPALGVLNLAREPAQRLVMAGLAEVYSMHIIKRFHILVE